MDFLGQGGGANALFIYFWGGWRGSVRVATTKGKKTVHRSRGGCCAGAQEWLVSFAAATTGLSSDGVGVASLRGGIRSLIASKPFASANDVILWFGEKPCRAANTKKQKKLTSNFFFRFLKKRRKINFPPVKNFWHFWQMSKNFPNVTLFWCNFMGNFPRKLFCKMKFSDRRQERRQTYRFWVTSCRQRARPTATPRSVSAPSAAAPIRTLRAAPRTRAPFCRWRESCCGSLLCADWLHYLSNVRQTIRKHFSKKKGRGEGRIFGWINGFFLQKFWREKFLIEFFLNFF